MASITLRNESETTIPDTLKQQLLDALDSVIKQLRAEGQTHASMRNSVVVLGLFSNGAERYTVMPKAGLRKYLADLQTEIYAQQWQVAPPELPRESLIQRCLGPSPGDSVRVLWMAMGYNGTLQIHLDKAKEDESTTLQERLRKTIRDAEDYMDKDELKLAQDIHEKIKDLPVAEAMQALKDAELASSAELQELRAHRAALGESRMDLVRHLLERLPDFRERWKSVQARVKKVVIPPDVKSANNLEATMMAAAYVFDRVTVDIGLSKEEVSFLVGHFSADDKFTTKLLEKMSGVLRGQPYSGHLQDFSIDWMKQGFPKLEVGQKLAASLACTDVPDDIEVLAPWKAWSLIIPPGLLGPASEEYGDLARLWCEGTDISFVITTKGGIIGPMTPEVLAKMTASSSMPGPVEVLWKALSSLVKGACLALANPDDYKRQPLSERSSKTHKKQRDGEPDFSVSRFMLSAPVQVDVRQHLLDVTSGKKGTGGGAPKVQFLVRGHWRNQAHGPGRALRKTIRIEAFWKGPEEGRVLLRNYKVKDEGDGVR